MNKTFKRTDEDGEALNIVHRMKQRKDESVEQVVTRFREQASLANIDLANGMLAIDYLKPILNEKLVDKITDNIDEPVDNFENWVKLAIKQDNK